MTCSQLAKRLGVKPQAITARRHRQDFSRWVSDHDPEGRSWLYSSTHKGYLATV
jgi:hypothetical protein